jgi:hypothetical protein
MSFPKCPHCKYEFDDEDIWYSGSTDFPTQNDGDETDTKCQGCGEELRIRLNLAPSWDFLDEDGEELCA